MEKAPYSLVYQVGVVPTDNGKTVGFPRSRDKVIGLIADTIQFKGRKFMEKVA
jgi:hypothetical protein